jgi:hypothetical protein
VRSLREETLAGQRYHRTLVFLPPTKKTTFITIRYKANLLTCATAIACERFRLMRGRWPTSLDELPKELLAAVPEDPFNGKPIKLVKLPDGIAIVTVGMKQETQHGEKPWQGPLGGDEYGWRLFDPDQRGLPPIPKPELLKKDPF